MARKQLTKEEEEEEEEEEKALVIIDFHSDAISAADRMALQREARDTKLKGDTLKA